MGEWAPSALSYHPHAPGPSRPIRAREQKAAQHLEHRRKFNRARSSIPRTYGAIAVAARVRRGARIWSITDRCVMNATIRMAPWRPGTRGGRLQRSAAAPPRNEVWASSRPSRSTTRGLRGKAPPRHGPARRIQVRNKCSRGVPFRKRVNRGCTWANGSIQTFPALCLSNCVGERDADNPVARGRP